MINAKRAMEILEVSRPTLAEYCKTGKLTEIKLSSRKTRFYEDEIENFALFGNKN